LELQIVVLDCLLPKSRQLFEEKVHSQTKSWLRLCARMSHVHSMVKIETVHIIVALLNVMVMMMYGGRDGGCSGADVGCR